MNEVKKAATLTDLEQLNLSEKTRAYLTEKFDPIDSIIKHGRARAYKEESGEFKPTTKKWEAELISALREGGFIRPASELMMFFAVAKLYARVYYIRYYDDYFKNIESVDKLSNEQYEQIRSFTDAEAEMVRTALRGILPKKTYKVICGRFGLNDGTIETLKDLSQFFGTNIEDIRKTELGAIWKIRRMINSGNLVLPPIFAPPEDFEEEFHNLTNKLDRLSEEHQEAIYSLNRMTNVPFTNMKEVNNAYDRYIGKTFSPSDSIVKMGLTTRTTNCLLRNGFFTVQDILDRVNDETWKNIRNFSQRSFTELVEVMHENGYEDFCS